MPGPPTNTYGTPCPNMAWPAYQHIQSSLHKHVSCLARLLTHMALLAQTWPGLPTNTYSPPCTNMSHAWPAYQHIRRVMAWPAYQHIQMHSCAVCLPTATFFTNVHQAIFKHCLACHAFKCTAPASKLQLSHKCLSPVALLTNLHQAVLNRGLACHAFKCTAPGSKL